MKRTVLVCGLLLTWVLSPRLAVTERASAQEAISVIIHNVEAEYLPTGDAYEVTAYLSVLDAQGAPISGLQAGDFDIREDGSKVERFEIGPAGGGIRLVLVIDTSGSMGAEGKMNAVKEATESLIQGLGAEDQVALVSFNQTPKVEINLTPDLTAVQNFVALLGPVSGSGTCMWDAAYEAVQIASAIEPGRRAVILLTDGIDELPEGGPCSQKTLDDLVGLATDTTVRVPLFTVGVGNRVNEQDLARVADLTGGRVYLAENASKVLGLFDVLGEQLRAGYSLRYVSAAASGEHNLFIQVDHGGARDQDSRRFRAAELPSQILLLGIPAGNRVIGEVRLTAQVNGQVAPAMVEFFTDDHLLARDDSPPFEAFWQTAGLEPGEHSVRTVAYASDGRVIAVAQEDVRSYEATEAQAPVSLDIEGAQPGQTIRADTALRVTGDNLDSIARVVFTLDGQKLSEVGTPPFEVTVQPSTGGPGQHLLEVTAYDAEGREVASKNLELVFARRAQPGLFVGLGVACLLGVTGAVVLVTRRRRVKPAAAPARPQPLPPVEKRAAELAAGAEVLAALTIEESHDESLLGQRFEIRGPEVSIGRSDTCSVVIPIQPVSREHAVIKLRGKRDASMTMDVVLTGDPAAALAGLKQPFVIYDGSPETGRRSTFGTFVDGTEATMEEGIPLKDGCKIQLGRAVADGHLEPVILRFRDLRVPSMASAVTEPEVDAFATMADQSRADESQAGTEGLPWEAVPTIMRGRKEEGGYETEGLGFPTGESSEGEGDGPDSGATEPQRG